MESTLGSDLARLVRVWRALIDHRLKPLELTQTHWVTLYNINRLPPEQSQIQLEEKGLITRHTCANDRRAKRIKLTEQSSPIIEQVDGVICSTRKEILGGISSDEIAVLSGLIDKLEKNIIQLQTK